MRTFVPLFPAVSVRLGVGSAIIRKHSSSRHRRQLLLLANVTTRQVTTTQK